MALTRIFTLAACVQASCLLAADWPMFRGPNAAGVSEGPSAPGRLDIEQNLVWRAETPLGKSSPIIAGGRLYVTGHEADRRIVLCLDRLSGEVLWRRELKAEREEPRHPNNDPASPTPVADERAVYTFFSEIGLAAFSRDGKPLWKTPLGPFDSVHGMASSPILAGNLVILLADHMAGSFLAAFDSTTGEVVWKTDREDYFGGYATPILYRPARGPAQIIAPGNSEVAGYSVSDGERLWSASGLGNPCATPVLGRDLVFVTSRGSVGDPPSFESMLEKLDSSKDGAISRDEFAIGFGTSRPVDVSDLNGDGRLDKEEYDRQSDQRKGRRGVAAVPLDGSGDVTSRILWQLSKGTPDVATPLYYRGLLYLFKSGGIVTVVDPVSGEIAKQERIREAIGEYWSSPVAMGGRIYAANTDGKVAVIESGRDWSTLTVSDLGEPIYATPVLNNGRIYVRTEKAIYAFGE